MQDPESGRNAAARLPPEFSNSVGGVHESLGVELGLRIDKAVRKV